MKPLNMTSRAMLCLPLLSTFDGTSFVESRTLQTTGGMPENAVVCQTKEQCRQKYQSMGIGSNFYVGDYASKGCFLKGTKAYFGTGATSIDQISQTDLPGVRERIWCDIETDPPSAKPTPSPTNKPTPKPITDSPTKQPTPKPVTGSPTKETAPVSWSNQLGQTGLAKQPSNKPSPEPTIQVIFEFLIDDPTPSPSMAPTLRPTAKPTTKSPTMQPTAKPTTKSPIMQPTNKPTTKSPTMQPTSKPTTKSPTIQPTAKPTTKSPTMQPSQNPTEQPTQSPTASPTTWVAPLPSIEDITTSTSLPANKPTQRNDTTAVVMSPFIMTLQTAPQTEIVDTDELSYIISSHLLSQMQATFTDAVVTGVEVDASAIRGQRRQLQQNGLVFASDLAESKEHDFKVSGEAYFSGSSVPTLETLDAVTQESFEGDSGNDFMRSLQYAEDPGLQSTRSISVDVSDETADSERGEILESRLPAVMDDDPIADYPLYVLAIVFGVGFILVAMYVVKTRRGRRIELEHEMNVIEDDDEEAADVPVFPKYIEVGNNSDKNSKSARINSAAVTSEPQPEAACSFYGSIREALSDQSELAVATSSPKASDISVLTDPHILTQASSEESIDQFMPVKSQDSCSTHPVGNQSQSQALPESLSSLPRDLPSISETSDNKGDKNLEDTSYLNRIGSGIGSFWGLNNTNDESSSDYDISAETSRVSSRVSMADTGSVTTGVDTLSVTTGGASLSQVPDDLVSEGASSRKTAKICNTNK